MKISILFHTVNFCGDHAADCVIALDPKPGETVEQLIERAGIGRNPHAGKGECITIRIVYDRGAPCTE